MLWSVADFAAAQQSQPLGRDPRVTIRTLPSTSEQPASRGVASSQAASAPGDRKRLTIENAGGDFDGKYATGMTWLDADHFLHRREGRAVKVRALDDSTEPTHDDAAIRDELIRAGMAENDAAAAAARPGVWSKDRRLALVIREKSLFAVRPAEAKAWRVADLPEHAELDLSPGGSFASFVSKNDLHVVDLAGGRVRRLTQDGSETLLNGILDWVYQEEIYGRGRFRAYWWREDDAYVAFLQLDESKVPAYTLIDPIPYRQSLEKMHYPKAGDPNPSVRLGVTRPRGGIRWVSLSKYDGHEILIVQVSWSPDGRLIFSVQDREQRWLDLNACDPDTGQVRTLLREESPAWVENTRAPQWQPDGTFLWTSERDGFNHIYQYASDGLPICRLTAGDWPVDDLLGVDAAGFVYFTAERESTVRKHAYRVPLRGGPVERLTDEDFNHRVQFNKDFSLFIDTFSNARTPPRVQLRRADGSLVRVISANEGNRLDEFDARPVEYFRVPTRDGTLLNASRILPADFDPSKKYPVWCPVYAGPNAPTVTDGWGGRRMIDDQVMASDGVIVWRCDPRSASGDGAKYHWQAYQQLGVTELADIEDGLRWLIAQGGVDESRIGIAGHSYGGYMAAYALTHSTMFKCGIAGAPVTDWRDYDTIYTERYMRTPQNNPDGYDKSSVTKSAANLSGRLLIAHGIMDENVHYQNTAQFIRELQKHEKLFELMLYPKDRHGFVEGGGHWREMQRDFIRRNL